MFFSNKYLPQTTNLKLKENKKQIERSTSPQDNQAKINGVKFISYACGVLRYHLTSIITGGRRIGRQGV